MSRADIGVFGGSGFYSFLEDTETVDVDTPFGKPSAPPVIGRVGDVRVAFIPRHGRHHEFPPHRVPYRANVWAMKELGVGRVVGPNACGSLTRDVKPGEFVISAYGVEGSLIYAASAALRQQLTPDIARQRLLRILGNQPVQRLLRIRLAEHDALAATAHGRQQA